jgi:hypothetical protein
MKWLHFVICEGLLFHLVVTLSEEESEWLPFVKHQLLKQDSANSRDEE